MWLLTNLFLTVAVLLAVAGAQVISTNTQNPAGAVSVVLDGFSIVNEAESVEYRFDLPTMSQSEATSLSFIGGSIGSSTSPYAHTLVINGCSGDCGVLPATSVTVRGVAVTNSHILFAGAFPSGSAITLDALTGFGTTHAICPYFVGFEDLALFNSEIWIKGSSFGQVYSSDSSPNTVIHIQGEQIKFASSTFQIIDNSFTAPYRSYSAALALTNITNIIASSFMLVAGSSFSFDRNSIDYHAYDYFAVSLTSSLVTIADGSLLASRRNSMMYGESGTAMQLLGDRSPSGVYPETDIFVKVDGTSFIDVSHNTAHHVFHSEYTIPYSQPSFIMFQVYYIAMHFDETMPISFSNASYLLIDNNTITDIQESDACRLQTALMYSIEADLQLLDASSVVVTNNKNIFLLGTFNGVLVMDGASTFAVTSNVIDTRWALDPDRLGLFWSWSMQYSGSLIETWPRSAIRGKSTVNVSNNVVHDSGRVVNPGYLVVRLLASGGNISDSVLAFNNNEMIIAEIDREEMYGNQYDRDGAQFLRLVTKMYLDRSVVSMKGNTAICASDDRCDYEKLSWGTMFSFSSWEMHSGTTVTITDNSAQMAATGVRLALGSLRGASLVRVQHNTINGMAGPFNLAGIYVTSHATLALLEASSFVISHNLVNFTRASPPAFTDLSDFYNYFGYYSTNASFGILVSGGDIVLSDISALTIDSNTVLHTNAAPLNNYGVAVMAFYPASGGSGGGVDTKSLEVESKSFAAQSVEDMQYADYSAPMVLRKRSDMETLASMTSYPTIAIGSGSRIDVTRNTISLYSLHDYDGNAGRIDGVCFTDRVIAADHSEVLISENIIRTGSSVVISEPAAPRFVSSTSFGVSLRPVFGDSGGVGIPSARSMKLSSTYYYPNLSPSITLLSDAFAKVTSIFVAIDYSSISVSGNTISMNNSQTTFIHAMGCAWAVNSSVVTVSGNSLRMDNFQGSVRYLSAIHLGNTSNFYFYAYGTYPHTHYAFRSSKVMIEKNTFVAKLTPLHIDYFSPVCTSTCSGGVYTDYCMTCKPPLLEALQGFRMEAGRILAAESSDFGITGNSYDVQFDPYELVVTRVGTLENFLGLIRASGQVSPVDTLDDENFDMCAGYDAASSSWYYYDCDGNCEAFNEEEDYFFYYRCGETPQTGKCYNGDEHYYYDCYMNDCVAQSSLHLDFDAWYNDGYYYYYSCDTPGYGGLCKDNDGNRYDCDYSSELCTATDLNADEYYLDCKELNATLSCSGYNGDRDYYYYYECDSCRYFDEQFSFYYWFDCGVLGSVDVCTGSEYYNGDDFYYAYNCDEQNSYGCQGTAVMPFGSYYYNYPCDYCQAYSQFYQMYYYYDCGAGSSLPQIGLDGHAMHFQAYSSTCYAYNDWTGRYYYFDCNTPGFGGDCYNSDSYYYYDCDRCQNEADEGYYYYSVCGTNGTGGKCSQLVNGETYYYDCPRFCGRDTDSYPYFYYSCEGPKYFGDCFNSYNYYYYACDRCQNEADEGYYYYSACGTNGTGGKCSAVVNGETYYYDCPRYCGRTQQTQSPYQYYYYGCNIPHFGGDCFNPVNYYYYDCERCLDVADEGYYYYSICGEDGEGGKCSQELEGERYYYDCPRFCGFSYESYPYFYYGCNVPHFSGDCYDSAGYYYYSCDRCLNEADEGYYYYSVCGEEGKGGKCSQTLDDETYYYDCPRFCGLDTSSYPQYYYYGCNVPRFGGDCYDSEYYYYYDCPRCEGSSIAGVPFYSLCDADEPLGDTCYSPRTFTSDAYYYDCVPLMDSVLHPFRDGKLNSKILAGSNLKINDNTFSIKPIFEEGGLSEETLNILANYSHPYEVAVGLQPMPVGLRSIASFVFVFSNVPQVGLSMLGVPDTSSIQCHNNSVSLSIGFGSLILFYLLTAPLMYSRASYSVTGNTFYVRHYAPINDPSYTYVVVQSGVQLSLYDESSVDMSYNNFTFLSEYLAGMIPYTVVAACSGKPTVTITNNVAEMTMKPVVVAGLVVGLQQMYFDDDRFLLQVSDNTIRTRATLDPSYMSSQMYGFLTQLLLTGSTSAPLTFEIDRNTIQFDFVSYESAELLPKDVLYMAFMGYLDAFADPWGYDEDEVPAVSPSNPGRGLYIRNNVLRATYDSDFDGSENVFLNGIALPLSGSNPMVRYYGFHAELTDNAIEFLPPDDVRLCTPRAAGGGVLIMISQPIANSEITVKGNTVRGIFGQGGVVVLTTSSSTDPPEISATRKDIGNTITLSNNIIQLQMCSDLASTYYVPADWTRTSIGGGIVYGAIESSGMPGSGYVNERTTLSITGNTVATTLMPYLAIAAETTTPPMLSPILNRKMHASEMEGIYNLIPHGIRVNAWSFSQSQVDISSNTIALVPRPEQEEVTTAGILLNVDSFDNTSLQFISNVIVLDTENAPNISFLPDTTFIRIDTPVPAGVRFSETSFELSFNKFHTNLKALLSGGGALAFSDALTYVNYSTVLTARNLSTTGGSSRAMCNYHNYEPIENYTSPLAEGIEFDAIDACPTTTTTTSTTTTTTTITTTTPTTTTTTATPTTPTTTTTTATTTDAPTNATTATDAPTNATTEGTTTSATDSTTPSDAATSTSTWLTTEVSNASSSAVSDSDLTTTAESSTETSVPSISGLSSTTIEQGTLISTTGSEVSTSEVGTATDVSSITSSEATTTGAAESPSVTSTNEVTTLTASEPSTSSSATSPSSSFETSLSTTSSSDQPTFEASTTSATSGSLSEVSTAVASTAEITSDAPMSTQPNVTQTACMSLSEADIEVTLLTSVVPDSLLRSGGVFFSISLNGPWQWSETFSSEHVQVIVIESDQSRGFASSVNWATALCSSESNTPNIASCTISQSPQYDISSFERLAITVSGAAVRYPDECPASVDSTRRIQAGLMLIRAEVQAGSRSLNVVSAVLAGGSVIFLLVGDGTAVEVQVLVLLMQCLCASDWDHQASDALKYFLAPFAFTSDMGAVLGNVGILMVVTVAHWGLIFLLSNIREVSLRLTAATCFFPAIPFVFAQTLYAGTLSHMFRSLNNDTTVEAAVSGVLGFIYLIGVPVVLVVFTRKMSGSYSIRDEDTANGWRRFVLTRGHWGGPIESRLVMGSHGQFHSEGNRWVVMFPYAVALVATVVLDAIPMSDTARYALALALSVACLIFMAVRRPHRSILTSALSACCFLWLALLCGAQLASATNSYHANTNFRTAAMVLVIVFSLFRAVHSTVLLIVERSSIALTAEGVDKEMEEEQGDLQVDADDVVVASGSRTPARYYSAKGHFDEVEEEVHSLEPGMNSPQNFDFALKNETLAADEIPMVSIPMIIPPTLAVAEEEGVLTVDMQNDKQAFSDEE